jgi:hypothetical protein
MLGQQTIRSPNAYSAHTRLLSVASLVRVWLEEFYGSTQSTGKFGYTTRVRPSHGDAARSFVVGVPRCGSLKNRGTGIRVQHEESEFRPQEPLVCNTYYKFLSGSPNSRTRRSLHSQKSTMAIRESPLSLRTVKSQNLWTPITASMPHRPYTTDAQKPAHQALPGKPPLDPDREGNIVDSEEHEGHAIGGGSSKREAIRNLFAFI